MKLIAIDPGASGGIAWMHDDGSVACEPMPCGMTEQVDTLRSTCSGYASTRVEAVVEKTGTYVPGNSATAAVKFARHCGHIEAALYCFGVPTEQIAPNVWMKSLGALPHEKTERKRAIKEQMARLYPNLDVTLKTADALAILTWAINRNR